MLKKIILLAIIFIAICANAQWSSDAAVNTVMANRTGTESQPKLILHTNGYTYMSWFSNEVDNGNYNYNVRLQILDRSGNKTLGAQGLLVSSHPSLSSTTDYSMQVDSLGNAIIVFQDNRAEMTINAYKISPTGEFLWGNDGKQLSTGLPGQHYSPQAIVLSDKSVVVTWEYVDLAYKSVICLTKLKPDGSFFWNTNVKQISYTGSDDKIYCNQQLVNSDGENFILHYSFMSTAFYMADRNLLARKYNSTGDQLWDTVINDQGGMPGYAPVCVKSDKAGGMIIAWSDDRDGDQNPDAFIQHLTSNGSPILQANGLMVAERTNDDRYYYPVADFVAASQEYVVMWRETDSNQSQIGLFVQKINSSGQRLWGNQGKVILPMITMRNVDPGIISGLADGQAMVFYSSYDPQTNYFSTLNCAKIDNAGNFLWNSQSRVISSAVSAKSFVSIAQDNAAQNWVLGWADDRFDDGKDIYVQNVNDQGVLGEQVSEIDDNSIYDKSGLKLLGNYPNPFNPETVISFQSNADQVIKLTVFNSSGAVVQEFNKLQTVKGLNNLKFSAVGLNSGLYFYRITANQNILSGKMLLVK